MGNTAAVCWSLFVQNHSQLLSASCISHPIEQSSLQLYAAFRLNSFNRATGPLLVQENPDLSVVLELPVLLGDVIGVIAFGDFGEVLYSPSTYTASLVHVFLFLRWT